MKCKNCGKEIDQDEIFCKECEKKFKKASSKKELNELEELINDQIELNKLDQTKELIELNDLVVEDINVINEVDDKKEETELETREEKNKDLILETREEKNKDVTQPIEEEKKKKSKKNILIIIISIVVIVLVVAIIFLFKRTKSDDEPINYKKIIDDYGKALDQEIVKYYEEKKEIPSWQYINKLVKNDNKIICEVKEIYNTGIYLDECKVNNVKVKNSYGNKEEEVVNRGKIDIYKIEVEDNIFSYFGNNEPGAIKAGSITCKTEKCEYINAYNNYVIIREDNSYYLYDYDKDKQLFGPFNLSNNYNQSLLLDKNTLYGIYYNEDGINKLYSTASKKVFSNIKGTLLYENNYNVLYKYNYAIFNNKGVNDFINLNTGNVSYSIKGTIKEFREDNKSKILYMLIYEDNSNEFKVYNNNGKALFNGEKFINIIFNSDNFIVSKNSNYKVYDSKLNLKTNSKNYDSILGIYNDFIVVLDNNTLKIVDLDDKELAVFNLTWNNNYSLDYESSGWNTIDNKKGIYLNIINKNSTNFTCYTDTKGNESCNN